ncbi:MAG: tetratricopeptide repeat protein [Bacteroidota bacterium]
MQSRRAYLLQLLNSAPNDTFVLFALAKEFEKSGELQDALDYYLKLQATDPAYVGLYYHLGKLYEQLGNGEQALETYRNGIEVARNQGDMHAMSELNGAKLNLEYD